MPQIDPINSKDMTDEISRLIAHAEKEGAPNPRVVSIYAKSPIGVAFFQFWNILMGPSALPIRLKELVRIFNSAGEGCAYCSIVRSTTAKAEGVTEDLLAELVDYQYSNDFSEQEKAALHYAELYRTDPNQLQEDTYWQKLHGQFTDEQIIELGIICMLTTGGGPFVKSLALTSWEEVCTLSPKLAEVRNRIKARKGA